MAFVKVFAALVILGNQVDMSKKCGVVFIRSLCNSTEIVFGIGVVIAAEKLFHSFQHDPFAAVYCPVLSLCPNAMDGAYGIVICIGGGGGVAVLLNAQINGQPVSIYFFQPQNFLPVGFLVGKCHTGGAVAFFTDGGVVGKAQRSHLQTQGGLHDFFRCVGTVGEGGMGVEISLYHSNKPLLSSFITVYFIGRSMSMKKLSCLSLWER